MIEELQEFIKDLIELDSRICESIKDELLRLDEASYQFLNSFHEDSELFSKASSLISQELNRKYEDFINQTSLEKKMAKLLVVLKTHKEDYKLNANRITELNTLAQDIIPYKALLKTILKEVNKIEQLDGEMFDSSKMDRETILANLEKVSQIYR